MLTGDFTFGNTITRFQEKEGGSCLTGRIRCLNERPRLHYTVRKGFRRAAREVTGAGENALRYSGGHLTHGWNVNFSGMVYRSVLYGYNAEQGITGLEGVLDYDEFSSRSPTEMAASYRAFA